MGIQNKIFENCDGCLIPLVKVYDQWRNSKRASIAELNASNHTLKRKSKKWEKGSKYLGATGHITPTYTINQYETFNISKLTFSRCNHFYLFIQFCSQGLSD